MRFFEDRGDLGPPPDQFRMDRGPSLFASPRTMRWIVIGVGTLALIITLNAAKSIYVDLLWFDSVGYEGVYRKAIFARVLLFFAGAFISAAVIGGNIWLARRLAPEAPEESFIEEVDPQAIRRIGAVIMIALTIFMALIFGSALGGQWQTLLSWLNGVPFGVKDPQFGRDISFYLFDLPAYHHLQSWVLALLMVATFAAGSVYALTFSLQRFVLNITQGMRLHLSVLVGLVLIVIGVALSVRLR